MFLVALKKLTTKQSELCNNWKFCLDARLKNTTNTNFLKNFHHLSENGEKIFLVKVFTAFVSQNNFGRQSSENAAEVAALLAFLDSLKHLKKPIRTSFNVTTVWCHNFSSVSYFFDLGARWLMNTNAEIFENPRHQLLCPTLQHKTPYF